MSGFTVTCRNYGHWDISIERKRAYRIRGGPGNYLVYDVKGVVHEAKTVQAAMSFLTDLLMFELVVAEGQDPVIIESWNV